MIEGKEMSHSANEFEARLGEQFEDSSEPVPPKPEDYGEDQELPL